MNINFFDSKHNWKTLLYYGGEDHAVEQSQKSKQLTISLKEWDTYAIYDTVKQRLKARGLKTIQGQRSTPVLAKLSTATVLPKG